MPPDSFGDIAHAKSHCLFEFEQDFSPEEIEVNRLLSLKNRVRNSSAGLAQLITREVIEKLPQPAVIAKEDVLESVAEHLVVTADRPFEQAYSQFVLSVLGCLVPPPTFTGGLRCTDSERFDIGFAPWAFTAGTFIAELPSGFKISCDQVIETGHGEDFTLLASVIGVSSARALDQASRQCFEIMRSVLPRLCRQEVSTSYDDNGLTDADRVSTVRTIVRARLQQCLSMYFGAESKKMTFQGRRIRNAVQLLIESDRQVHNAIGLALSCAAIESLLGEKTHGISEDVATKTATLLFPDAEYRRWAINIVKKMYDTRSRSLHGEQLTVEDKTREQVRTLAGTLLRAVLDWLEFSARFGDAEAEAPEFFAALQYATDTGKRFVGPSYDLGKSLALDWAKE